MQLNETYWEPKPGAPVTIYQIFPLEHHFLFLGAAFCKFFQELPDTMDSEGLTVKNTSPDVCFIFYVQNMELSTDLHVYHSLCIISLWRGGVISDVQIGGNCCKHHLWTHFRVKYQVMNAEISQSRSHSLHGRNETYPDGIPVSLSMFTGPAPDTIITCFEFSL